MNESADKWWSKDAIFMVNQHSKRVETDFTLKSTNINSSPHALTQMKGEMQLTTDITKSESLFAKLSDH